MLFFNKKIHNGVKIPKNKEATKNLNSEVAPPPELLHFPMAMHIGKPAEVVVEVGDFLKMGTLIGKRADGISSNIHSSASGKVVEIKKLESPRGESTTVIF